MSLGRSESVSMKLIHCPPEYIWQRLSGSIRYENSGKTYCYLRKNYGMDLIVVFLRYWYEWPLYSQEIFYYCANRMMHAIAFISCCKGNFKGCHGSFTRTCSHACVEKETKGKWILYSRCQFLVRVNLNVSTDSSKIKRTINSKMKGAQTEIEAAAQFILNFRHLSLFFMRLRLYTK